MAFARAAFRARFCISIPPGGIFLGGIFLLRAYGNASEKRKMDAPFIAAVRLAIQLGRAILGRRPVSVERFQGETGGLCVLCRRLHLAAVVPTFMHGKGKSIFARFFCGGLRRFFQPLCQAGRLCRRLRGNAFGYHSDWGAKRKVKWAVLHIHLLTYPTSP